MSVSAITSIQIEQSYDKVEDIRESAADGCKVDAVESAFIRCNAGISEMDKES